MLKRPLIPATLLFLLGIILIAYNVNLIITMLLCLAVCGIILYKTRKPIILIFALLFILVGMGRMLISENCQERIVASFSGKKEFMTLTVTDFSRDNSALAYFTEGGTKYKVLLYYKTDVELLPGDIVEGEISLEQPRGSKVRFPGYVQSLAADDVFLIANGEEISLTNERECGFSGVISSFRIYMDSLSKKHFSGDDRALFNAMVIGDKRLISDELYASLQASGLNHIAVVSGMHLSVAIAFLMVIARFLFGRTRGRYIFVLLGAFLLMFLTGTGPSMVRAFIMCAIYLSAEFLYRDNDSPTALSLAVLLMTLANPFIIFDVGFLLSVFSVIGILMYNRKLFQTLKGFTPAKLAACLSLSISAQLTVLPAVVYYFGKIPTYSLLSNVLLVPISGIYVILGMLFILLSPLPFVSEIIAFVMKMLSGAIIEVSELVEKLPSSLVEIEGNMPVLFTVWIVLLVLVVLHPIKKEKMRGVALAVAATFVCVAVYAPKDKVQIYPIIYGAKTMTVMHLSDENAFLIDCPNLYDALVIGKESVPFTSVILSGDDSGKLFSSDSHVERIIASDNLFGEKEREKIISEAKERNIHLIFADDFEKIQIGNAVMEYIPVEGFNSCRLVKVYYDGKTYLSFQGVDGTDIVKFGENGFCFESDYVILPYTAFSCDEEIFEGEIIR